MLRTRVGFVDVHLVSVLKEDAAVARVAERAELDVDFAVAEFPVGDDAVAARHDLDCVPFHQLPARRAILLQPALAILLCPGIQVFPVEEHDGALRRRGAKGRRLAGHTLETEVLVAFAAGELTLLDDAAAAFGAESDSFG